MYSKIVTGFGYRIEPTDPLLYLGGVDGDFGIHFAGRVESLFVEAGLKGKARAVESSMFKRRVPADYALFALNTGKVSYDPATGVYTTEKEIPEEFDYLVNHFRSLDWINVIDDEMLLITMDALIRD